MTSDENNDNTINFFKDNNYFGYSKKDICFFKQDELPLLNKQGKLLIDENMNIKKASNGNGSIFKAMLKNGIIENMEKRKIEWIFVGSVDNILLKNVDTLLIGLTVSQKKQIGTRTILKKSPEERVGVLCKQNGKIRVIEYTEIPEEISKITNENGEIVYGESHIMCNLFNINALKICASKELEYHVAIKKANYLNENKELVISQEPNAYKFEQFIFDSFKLFENIAVLRGTRENDFAPIKNKDGEDSPQTAKKLYENYWKNKKNVI